MYAPLWAAGGFYTPLWAADGFYTPLWAADGFYEPLWAADGLYAPLWAAERETALHSLVRFQTLINKREAAPQSLVSLQHPFDEPTCWETQGRTVHYS